jgi:hypothetical protein
MKLRPCGCHLAWFLSASLAHAAATSGVAADMIEGYDIRFVLNTHLVPKHTMAFSREVEP